MILSSPKEVKCPHCGKEAFVFQIALGNTCHAVVWSDFKMEAPMLPNVSPIFQCESCKKYYRVDNQPDQQSISMAIGLFGVFEFDRLMSARTQFEVSGEELPPNMDVLLIHGYNDKYQRGDCPRNLDDELFFLKIVDEIVSKSNEYDPCFIAELFRETGRFEQCMEWLDKCEDPSDDFVKKIRRHAQKKDSSVFKYRWLL